MVSGKCCLGGHFPMFTKHSNVIEAWGHGERLASFLIIQEQIPQYYRASCDDVSLSSYIHNKAGKTCFEKMWQRSRLAGSRGVCFWSRWKKSRPSGQCEEMWPHPAPNAMDQIAAAGWGNRNGMLHCHCSRPTVNYINSCNFSYGNSERTLRVFQNWVIRNNFGPKKHEVTADWK